ncbi:MAG: NUDIX hydrolase [Rhizobiaceae bacterium]|nr:NUDIX hydrolase [Rhizobiaceae bacterium]
MARGKPKNSVDGMTREALDKAESKDFALGEGPKRPRDAATLILLDRQGGKVQVLLGRRSRHHAFMPGRFVFPGGRTDPADARISVAADLHPDERLKLRGTGARASDARARAIALSAIRETYEEAGLLIGTPGEFATRNPGWTGFAEHKVMPALDRVRYVARAITPPGRVRRFDTRFLTAWKADVAVELAEGGPTEELEELAWFDIADAKELEVPLITKTVLSDLEARLTSDPELTPGGPVPFYRMLHRRFLRDVL